VAGLKAVTFGTSSPELAVSIPGILPILHGIPYPRILNATGSPLARTLASVILLYIVPLTVITLPAAVAASAGSHRREA
jgi:hypothetical protein